MASPRRYDGLHELTYLFHDRDVSSPCVSRGLRHKRINTSTVLAGQTLAIKEADDGFGARASCALIWHASIWNRKPDNPFGTKLSPMS